MRSLLFAAPILTAALLSSCGNPAPANTFAGNYSGTFAVMGAPDNGTLALNVLGDGSLSGTITLTSSSAATKPSSPVSGKIENDGTLNATYQYTGGTFPVVTLKGTVTLSGSAATSTLNVTAPGVTGANSVMVNLTRK